MPPPQQNQQSISAELEQLRAWKAAAIKRFPELAVREETLSARKIAAAYFRKSGDTGRAQKIERGELDNSPVIQIAILASGGGND